MPKFKSKGAQYAYAWKQDDKANATRTYFPQHYEIITNKYIIPDKPYTTITVDGESMKTINVDVWNEKTQEWVRINSAKWEMPKVLFNLQLSKKKGPGGGSKGNGLYFGGLLMNGSDEPNFIPLWVLIVGAIIVLK